MNKYLGRRLVRPSRKKAKGKAPAAAVDDDEVDDDEVLSKEVGG